MSGRKIPPTVYLHMIDGSVIRADVHDAGRKWLWRTMSFTRIFLLPVPPSLRAKIRMVEVPMMPGKSTLRFVYTGPPSSTNV